MLKDTLYQTCKRDHFFEKEIIFFINAIVIKSWVHVPLKIISCTTNGKGSIWQKILGCPQSRIIFSLEMRRWDQWPPKGYYIARIEVQVSREVP